MTSKSLGASASVYRRWTALTLTILTLYLLSVVEAFAHNVTEGDAGYIQEIWGVKIVPFMYLGAKHMITGYDHILFLLGVVFFLYRMKDVAVYLASKRNQIGYTKLKYNLVGTNVSLERLFYNYLLNAFTRKSTANASIVTSLTITDPNILDALPLLSDISKSFTIEIQELYDTSNYLDRDPAVSPDKYIQQEPGVPTALYTSGDYDIPVDYLIAEVISAVATS